MLERKHILALTKFIINLFLAPNRQLVKKYTQVPKSEHDREH